MADTMEKGGSRCRDVILDVAHQPWSSAQSAIRSDLPCSFATCQSSLHTMLATGQGEKMLHHP